VDNPRLLTATIYLPKLIKLRRMTRVYWDPVGCQGGKFTPARATVGGPDWADAAIYRREIIGDAARLILRRRSRVYSARVYSKSSSGEV